MTQGVALQKKQQKQQKKKLKEKPSIWNWDIKNHPLHLKSATEKSNRKISIFAVYASYTKFFFVALSSSQLWLSFVEWCHLKERYVSHEDWTANCHSDMEYEIAESARFKYPWNVIFDEIIKQVNIAFEWFWIKHVYECLWNCLSFSVSASCICCRQWHIKLGACDLNMYSIRGWKVSCSPGKKKNITQNIANFINAWILNRFK